nr:hypothetical protein [Odoribacter splanchnicus]
MESLSAASCVRLWIFICSNCPLRALIIVLLLLEKVAGGVLLPAEREISSDKTYESTGCSVPISCPVRFSTSWIASAFFPGT